MNIDFQDMSTPERRTAIITGSSRGIGAAIALRLAEDGFAIVVNYSGNVDDAQKVVSQIQQQGGEAIAVQADVASSEDVARLYEATIDAFGSVDVVVNNAGLLQPGLVNLVDTDDALFDRLMSVNVKGSFNMMRKAVHHMKQGGRIINLSTTVLGLLLPGYSIYAATKAAVEAMTSILAKELRGRQITVNAIAPGPTATDLFFHNKTQQQIDQMAKLPPLERLGTPEDMANLVSFLVSEQGGWVNGQTIRSNGGIA